MATARVIFHRILRGSREKATDESVVTSRIFFTLEVDGQRHEELQVEVEQAGGAFDTAPLEVGRPQGYEGPFNQSAFRDATVEYYREHARPRDSGMHARGPARVRTTDDPIEAEEIAEFEIPES